MAARDQEVRMEELLSFLRVLVDGRLVTRNDEMAADRRKLQHLTGQSGKGSLRQKLKDKCLRDKFSEKKQAEQALKSVGLNLQRLKKETWSFRFEARTRQSSWL